MPPVLRVAVPVPLARLFDYLPPAQTALAEIAVGCRVLVPFGRGERVGVVVEIVEHSEFADDQLKTALAVLDSQPLLSEELLRTLTWTARYYQHPLGSVLETALPTALRGSKPMPQVGESALVLTTLGITQLSLTKVRSQARTTVLLRLLADGPRSHSALDASLPGWRSSARALRKREWIDVLQIKHNALPRMPVVAPSLTDEQQTAISAIQAQAAGFAPSLLEGITGSGKTEVYLALIEPLLARGRQALVLVPEIGLTPQLLRRFRERLGVDVLALHSGLADGERARAWLAAARGDAQVIVGTRSAIFTPLPNAGLIVVDEEHDASYKQQEGLRYSARDLALVRGRALGVPVVLGSATPSLETLANVAAGRYRHMKLGARPGSARPPNVRVLDIRHQRLQHGLCAELIVAIGDCLKRGEQALVFKNRRGYAPVLLCHDCGWHAACERCDRPLTLHMGEQRLRCHHCGVDIALCKHCPQCQSSHLQTLGLGTERLEEGLTQLFPDAALVRVDRETTRRKDALEHAFARLPPDQPGILVGTQMLAKGHDLPNLTLVAIIGVDEGLFSADFRASERLGQLIVQVSGRAGRALKPGTVYLQTHHPEHPLLRTLLRGGYRALAGEILAERRAAGFPPYAYLALLRAEAAEQAAVDEFLRHALHEFPSSQQTVQALGPIPAPMPRRAGRQRAQLLLQSDDRGALQALLPEWIAQLRASPLARRVRWSIDVDPADMY